jgi:hypothetical protein
MKSTTLRKLAIRSAANRKSARMAALLGGLAALAVTAAGAKEASASVFWNTVKWPSSNQGFTVIPVCIESGSTATESPDGALAGLIVDPNPSLDTVVTHVRRALAQSWEANSSVRFVGFGPCSALTPTERSQAVGLNINPDADNESYLGTYSMGITDGTNFKPWGNDFNRCIYYNWSTTHVVYDFACAEQYAVHEFGHAIGFDHEWRNPTVPASCPKASALSASQYSYSYPNTAAYTVFNAPYDWNSVMTYWDGCVDQTGVRFGSPTTDATDNAAVAKVYPPVVAGTYDVGVIAAEEGSCNGREPITIHMDDEDGSNEDSTSGWVGGVHIDPDHNSVLTFCRMNGTKFGKVAASVPGARDGDYAVLKLGAACPAGSVEFTRYFDNEDGSNMDFNEGNISPNTVDGNTTLHFCLFRPENSGGTTITSFFNPGFSYGVFAASNFTKKLATGWIYTDDEDGSNNDQLSVPDSATQTAVANIIEASNNTKMHTAQVR